MPTCSKPALAATLLAAFAFLHPALAQDAPPPRPPVPATPPAPAEPPPGPEQPAQPSSPTTTTPLAHVEVRGEGPIPMVLIPGLISDWSTYEAFMARNAAKYTMYAVTLPGFGESAAPPEPEGSLPSDGAWLENAERAILQMLDERSIEKPVLVGQAMGGHLALRLATAHPERFRSVVVLNSMAAYPIGGPTEDLDPGQRRMIANDLLPRQIDMISEEDWNTQQHEWLREAMADQERANILAERAKSVKKPVSRRYMLEYLGADITADLPQASLPVLVIAGLPDMPAADAATVRAMWPRLYAGAPDHTLVFFEGTREFVTEDAPAELDRAVDQFIKGEKVQGKELPARPAPEPAPAEPAPAPEAPKP